MSGLHELLNERASELDSCSLVPKVELFPFDFACSIRNSENGSSCFG